LQRIDRKIEPLRKRGPAFKQHGARFGQFDRSLVTVDQQQADCILYVLNSLRQRGLRDVHARRGHSEISFLGHRQEQPDLIDADIKQIEVLHGKPPQYDMICGNRTARF
jgi:hypothetical protein